MAIEHIIKAKMEKNDEFYTQYADIQKEVNAYLEYNPDVFRGKTILLPCDDPEWSNFTKFFAQNFERFGLKKLISTSYSLDKKTEKYKYVYQLSLFETESPKFDEKKNGLGLDFKDLISIDTAKLKSAFNINIDQNQLQSQTQGYMAEISNAISTDTTPARNAFMSNLNILANVNLQKEEDSPLEISK